MSDLLTIGEIAGMLKTSEGIAAKVMGDTPYIFLGIGKGKGRRYKRADVLAVINAKTIDPAPKRKGKKSDDDFWTLPKSQRRALCVHQS